jgi:DnaK suppressor protein
MAREQSTSEEHDDGSALDRTSIEVEALIDELRARRAYWLDRLERRQSLAQALSGDLAEPDDGPAAGATQRETDRLEPMVARAARHVDGLQRALDRAVQGRLTTCDRCGGHIPVERVRVLPETTLCTDCARASERRGGG